MTTTEIAPSPAISEEELAEARRLLDEAVALKGEGFVYKSQYGEDDNCLYLTYKEEKVVEDPEDGCANYGLMTPVGPSCIVGHVLVGKGVSMLNLRGIEGNDATQAVLLASADGEPAFRDEVVIRALLRAQRAQDAGKTWGEARREFENRIAEEQELQEVSA